MSDVGDEKVIEAEPATLVEEPPLGPVQTRSYRSRFLVIYGALGVVVALAAVAFVALMFRTDPAPPAKWSNWQPTGSDTAQARQIADQVAKRYRMKGGQQLVAAIVSPPKVTSPEGDVPVSIIAIRPDTSTGKKEDDDIDVLSTEHNLQFVLCGLGTACSIKGGTATAARHALLRREALELALYTFKYVDGIDSVSVFLPPRPDGAAPGTSIFIKKSDVKAELSRPLTASIGPKTPTIGTMPKRELTLVNRITQPHLYSYEYQQAQDGGAVLVYDPVVLGT